MAKRRKVSNLLALALLAALAERPMYPYEMASVLRARGKDQSIKINWGSLYTVVQNLEKHGFIEVTGTARHGRQPERTVYSITGAGRAELADWLRELVAVPEREYPRFEAALSEAGVLHPDDVIELLNQRLHRLEADIAAQRSALEEAGQALPRVFLIESEYHLAMCEAEATWVRGLLRDIADGALPGVPEWRVYHETGQLPPDLAELAERGRPPD
ncbi:MAG: PadR family transcriptional regulator [Trebonia sp.]